MLNEIKVSQESKLGNLYFTTCLSLELWSIISHLAEPLMHMSNLALLSRSADRNLMEGPVSMLGTEDKPDECPDVLPPAGVGCDHVHPLLNNVD